MNTQNQSKRYNILLSLLAFISLGLISCEDENENKLPEYELIIPSNAYSFIVTSVNNEEESTVYALPSFTENFETLGCSVSKVIYYVDDVYASTKTSAPFDLEYKTIPLPKGQHLLKAIFTVGGEGFREATVECQKEFTVGEWSSKQSDVKFVIDYDRYVRVGDKVYVSLDMIDKYNAGYKINKVEYYFDNKLISTKTDAPYYFDYSPTFVVGQSYPLRISISYYLDGSYNSYGYTYSTSIRALADDETRYLYISDYASNDSHFNNGEVISGTGLLYRGVDDNTVYELNLYWDDKLVGTSKTFPYKFNYTVKNTNKGIHQLKSEWKKYDKNGKYQGSQSSTDIITIDG